MDWTYFHLATNHIPVIGAIFGTVILLWGIFRNEGPVRTLGLAIMIFTALIAIPVYLTGEPAEDKIEGLPGVLESLIEEHEEFAKYALIAAIVSGVAAFGSLIYSKLNTAGRSTKALMLTTFALSVITVGMMGWTAKLGGVVRHTEIRAAGTATSAPAETRPARDDDDDK